MEEPILTPSSDRFVLFPIVYTQLYEMYQKQVASFWVPQEIKLDEDKKQWTTLTPDEQHFISHVIAFFAASDGIVIENLALRFMVDVQIPEARHFYSVQMAIEAIHSEMYSILIDTFVTDHAQKQNLFHAIETVPVVGQKAAWALKWIASSQSFHERLIAFAAVEGIFFSGSFCAIFWLKKRNLMPGLCSSNELISRDEGLHCDFACALYQTLKYRLPVESVHAIVGSAVEIEQHFVRDALPVNLIGMNAASMSTYIEFVADRLIVALGYPKLYDAVNPFEWMQAIGMERKTNFFELEVTNYALAHAMASSAPVYSFDSNF